MAIKRREKPLTPAEALEQARRQNAPNWVGVEPLMSAARNETKMSLYPLDSRINDRPWLFIFTDPTSYSAQDVLAEARLWRDRYQQQRISVLFIQQPLYEFLKDRDWSEAWAKIKGEDFAAAIDREGLLAAAFGITQPPALLIYSAAKIWARRAGKDWLQGAEADLQKFLRVADPGLPLLSVREPDSPFVHDLGSIEVCQGKAALAAAGVQFVGDWVFEAERAVTHSPTAHIQLAVDVPGTKLGIVAESLLRTESTDQVCCHVECETEIVNPRRSLAGEDLYAVARPSGGISVDSSEQRRGEWSLSVPRLYRLLKNLPAGQHRARIEFPQADRHAVVVYGFRFAD